jgi:CheY-like chemotaxis protein
MTYRILVVEDQDDLREIARFALGGAGYEVVEAAMMDIQLPVLDGYESTRPIKALPGMTRTTIIAV